MGSDMILGYCTYLPPTEKTIYRIKHNVISVGGNIVSKENSRVNFKMMRGCPWSRLLLPSVGVQMW